MELSEQNQQLAEVIAKGSKVFGGKDRFLAWMNHPNEALNNKTPELVELNIWNDSGFG